MVMFHENFGKIRQQQWRREVWLSGWRRKVVGGRRGWGFVLYRLITTRSKHEPLVMLNITAGLCYKPAVICSQDITNGSYHEPAVIISITAGSNGHYDHLLWTRQ